MNTLDPTYIDFLTYIWFFSHHTVTAPPKLQRPRPWMTLQPRSCGTSVLPWLVWLKHDSPPCFHHPFLLLESVFLFTRVSTACQPVLLSNALRSLHSQGWFHPFSSCRTEMICWWVHYLINSANRVFEWGALSLLLCLLQYVLYYTSMLRCYILIKRGHYLLFILLCDCLHLNDQLLSYI